MLLSGLLLLKDKDSGECREHSKNCASCHLSTEGRVHHELVVLYVGIKNERLLYSCVISVNVVGTWHA